MTTINVPYLDPTGTLTPLVIDALHAGASAANHPSDRSLIVLTFADDVAADAFAHAAGLDPVAPAPFQPAPAPDDHLE